MEKPLFFGAAGFWRHEVWHAFYLAIVFQALPTVRALSARAQQVVRGQFRIHAQQATWLGLAFIEPAIIQRLRDELYSLARQRGRSGLFPRL